MENVPAELKSIAPFLQRAREMEKADPVIAYWCIYHAAQSVIGAEVRPKEKESNEYLIGLLDKLDGMKAAMSDNDAITDDTAAAAYVENFALKIFQSADDEDRAGKASKATAMRFLAASSFLSILGSVSSSTSIPQHLDKIKYSKWKATSIIKALKAGVKPPPGPEGSELYADGTDSKGIDGLDPSAGIEPVGRTEEEAAFQGAMDAPGEPEGFPMAPSRPPQDYPEFEDPSAPSAPSPAFPSAPSATLPSFPSANFPPPSPHASLPTTPAAFPGPSAPPITPPLLPRTSPCSPTNPRSPLPTVYEPPPSKGLDIGMVATVQKHAKWAISALNYEDVDTARKELKLALELLGSEEEWVGAVILGGLHYIYCGVWY